MKKTCLNSVFVQQGDTHISLKIKLKRQKSGALWEIVSIQEESTGDGSKTCESSDDPPMTHSLAKVTVRYRWGSDSVNKLSIGYSQTTSC